MSVSFAIHATGLDAVQRLEQKKFRRAGAREVLRSKMHSFFGDGVGRLLCSHKISRLKLRRRKMSSLKMRRLKM